MKIRAILEINVTQIQDNYCKQALIIQESFAFRLKPLSTKQVNVLFSGHKRFKQNPNSPS